MPTEWVSGVFRTQGDASNQPSPAKITIDATVRGQLNTGGEYLWLEVDGADPIIFEVPSGAANTWFYTELAEYGNLVVSNLGSATEIESVGVGTSATLHLRGGNYGAATRALYEKTSGEGYSDDGLYLETRTYVFTWVEKAAGFSFESAPSPASALVDVNDGQTSYVDSKEAADLGEEIPSLAWTRPPEGLKGLTALNNGMMAAFDGRDIY